jgi:hypothetical protein
VYFTTLLLEQLEDRRLLASDFGDAPAPYPTLRADNGAEHQYLPGLCLGTSIDLEADGQPSIAADADDLACLPDEDGVTNVGGGGVMITGGLKRGDTAAQLDIVVTNTAGIAHPYSDAWIDFNQDGDWNDVGERIVSQPVVSGANTIEFAVPYSATLGATYARFRLHESTGPGLLPTGMATSGEVEDHRVLITFDVTNATEVAKLLARDAASGDVFGFSVAASNDVAVIGAQFDDDAGSLSGSAYVYERINGVWVQQAKLTASDAVAGDRFGYAVSASNGTIVVGAPYDDVRGIEQGSVYVFTRTSIGWFGQAKLTANQAVGLDHFGNSVSVSGDTVLIGAADDDDVGSDDGSAYVYVRVNGEWIQQARLTPSDATAGDRFGFAVSVLGDTAVISAPEDDDLGSGSGSAYVYARRAGVWAQQAKLVAGDGAALDYFDHSVSVSNDTVVIGAGDDDHVAQDAGSAYVYIRAGGGWTQQAKLTASDARANDYFGVSVCVSGDTAMIGAWADDDAGSSSGSAYVFTRSDGTWSQEAKLTASDAAAGDLFGGSVFVSGHTAVVGAYGNDDAGIDSGSAYIVDLDQSADFGDAPAPYPTLRTDGGAAHTVVAGFHLGASVDLESDGRTSLEADADDRANISDEDGIRNVGGSGLTITGGLHRGDSAAQLAVVVTNTAGVAHPYLDAWIDFNQDGDWNDLGEHIFSQPVVAGTNAITFAVPNDAVLGATIARFRLYSATGPGLLPTGLATAGEVEDHRVIITFDVTNPAEVAKLLASDAVVGDSFGFSVAISGDTAVIGVPDDDAMGIGSGSAYVYVLRDGAWAEQAKLVAHDAGALDYFGYAVSISGDIAVIGVPGDNDAGNPSGSASVFARSEGVWRLCAKLVASDAAESNLGGRAVAVAGNEVVIGAPTWERSNFGAAYVFDLEVIGDFGDAPSPYPTSFARGGALHEASGPRLGAVRDVEIDGVPSEGASSDDVDAAMDDEDGVGFGTMVAGDNSNQITLDVQNVSSSARVDAWIDFDADGSWEPNEKIVDSETLSAGLAALTFAVPETAVAGLTYARVRVSSAGGLLPTGRALDGEVEDYQVTIMRDVRVTLPSGAGSNDVSIRRNGTVLEVFNNATSSVLVSSPLAYTRSLLIAGSDTSADAIHIDMACGGFFALAGGVKLQGGRGDDDRLHVTGTGATRAVYSMSLSPLGSTQLTVTESSQSCKILYEDHEHITFDGLFTLTATDVLDVGSTTLVLGVSTPVNLGPLTLLSGGTLSSNSPLALAAGESLVGFGTVDARFSGEAGSYVEATGDLTIGKASSSSGFFTRGDLIVGSATVTLRDANQAVLGTETSLGAAASPGRLIASNGLVVDFGNNVVGYGTLETPNDATKVLMVNGAMQGNSAGEPITLPGYVKGVGTLDHVNITGTYSPGFSPAAVQNGSLIYGSAGTVVVELSGTLPGSGGYDQINHTGSGVLGGHLVVQLIDGFTPAAGNTFVLMTALEELSGEFSSVTLPPPPSGTRWSLVQDSLALRLTLADLPTAHVVARQVFYNRSAWDGNNPAPDASDDAAIASDKTVLLPGQTATFANYTSYDKGVNGLMVDVLDLRGTPTVDDFLFRMGNDNRPYGADLSTPADDWPWAPTPASITVRPGAGVAGSDRVTLVWARKA